MWLALGVALATELPTSAAAQPSGPPFPRLANIYLHGGVDPADIPALARWDVLVLDIAWTRARLQQMRALNPDIKLYFYVCAYAVQTPPPPYDRWRQENYDYAVANNVWWYNWNQTIASDWPGTQMANITALGASGPQGNWRQFIAARIERLMEDYPEIDGVFLDNYWRSIAWEQGNLIHVDSDCNPVRNPGGCDGVMDSDAQIDLLWNDAMRQLGADVRQRFDAIQARTPGRVLSIISNRSDDYFEYQNGTMHEYFPSGWTSPDPGNPYGYNWTDEMLSLPGGYLVAPFNPTPYRVSILNADWTGTAEAPNPRSADFERHKRFTLASTLMGDGYYSLDPAAMGHGALWWEPEFDHAGRGQGYLGYPLGAMQRIGVPTGPERIVNGGFATALTPWQAQPTNATGTVSLDAASYHSAPTSARITITNLPNPSMGNMKLTQIVPVQGGAGYTLSFWARASVAQQMLLHIYASSCPSSRCLNPTTVQLTTAWQRFEIPFVSSGTANGGLDFFVSRVGSVWLDDVSLRAGDTSVYRRDFENGTVILNYTTAPYTVDLGGSYRRLSVPGNPLYNGATVTSETLAPSDARILLTTSSPSPAPPPVPSARLDQNQPNPFNPSTTIRYSVPADAHVHLAVYDISGRLVRTLVNKRVVGGLDRTVIWDGKDRYGVPVRSGVYFYRIVTPSLTQSRKMTLLK
jgi:hypothetical protein